jgi:hypothetical protein
MLILSVRNVYSWILVDLKMYESSLMNISVWLRNAPVMELFKRVLSGELDVMGDTSSIGAARENRESTSTGLTREDVE